MIAHYTDSMTRLQKEIKVLINDFCDRYKCQFDGELLERRQYIENLEKEQKISEELRDEISDLEVQKKIFEDSINLCAKIEGELR